MNVLVLLVKFKKAQFQTSHSLDNPVSLCSIYTYQECASPTEALWLVYRRKINAT